MPSHPITIKGRRFLGLWWVKGKAQIKWRNNRAGANDLTILSVGLSSGAAFDSVKRRMPKKIKRREKYNADWTRKNQRKMKQTRREESFYEHTGEKS